MIVTVIDSQSFRAFDISHFGGKKKVRSWVDMLPWILKKTREDECLWLLVSSKETGYLLYVNEVFYSFPKKNCLHKSRMKTGYKEHFKQVPKFLSHYCHSSCS